jgi:hypothetical protein
MKNPGKLFEIIGGTYKGKYCIAYDKQQINYYLKDNRFFVHYYDDKEFKVPEKYVYSKLHKGKSPEDNGKNLLGIEKLVNLRCIGFTD